MKKLTLGFVFVAGLAVALQAATITKITGNPEVAPPSSLEWQKAQRNMKIGDNTKLRCGPGSKAELITNNGHKIKVWPKSEISLDKVDGETSKFSLFLGKIRSIVKKLKGREKFEVKTPVAVCSVRGTDFAVEIGEQNQMKVEVYEGQVAAQEEMTGAEVIVNAGEFTQVFQNQAPEEPQPLPEEPPADEAPAEPAQDTTIDETKEEMRNEIFQEISREDVLARAAEEIKLAEYQNGKAMVDVSGKRVRLEEYIVRTKPEEFKYVVLNTRDDRFDFGKIVFTFNAALPEDLTLATRSMFYYEGAAAPQWQLTDVLSLMSNTVDQVNEEATGGQMFPNDVLNPTSWSLSFADYRFLVNNQPWWQYTDSNSNGRFDAGEFSYYNIATGNSLSFTADFQYDSDVGKYYFTGSDGQKVYFNESDMPSGTDSLHFYQRNNYTATQWITVDDYVINDDGKIISVSELAQLSKTDLNKMAYESNFERVYQASVFEGRKIDLVFSAKLLIDAGILSLPEPSSVSQ